MVVERTEPPDRGAFSKEEGGGTGLPSSLAAAVTASLHEGREAKTAGGYSPGEGAIRKVTAAAAMVCRHEEGAGGAEGRGSGLPSSQAAAVMASPKESRETWSKEDHPPGDKEKNKGTDVAARVPMQDGLGSEGTGGQEPRNTPETTEGSPEERAVDSGGEDWATVVRGKAVKVANSLRVMDGASRGELEEESGIGVLARRLREEDTNKPRRNIEIREGDWECKDLQCKWRNFSWRKECMKCLKNPQGLKTLAKGGSGGTPEVESALERARRIGERGETARRHPKVLVLTINLLIDDKPNRRPQLEDHYVIMKQAGLNLAEVKGKVGKNGYLEVALQPGAASAAGALREVSKIVDNRITILSVREQGSTREVLVRWQEVPFGTLDETLYSYMELFSKPVRPGRNLWWEVCKEEDDHSPTGEMVGKWTGERSLMVTLKPGAGHIPVWHYVGGSRIRLQVPGRRSCPRCLQAVGECRGAGNWDKCTKENMPRGNWKDEQEKFLKSIGWNEEQQKIMEGLEKRVAEEGTDEEDAEAESREETERTVKEAEEKEGLVPRLDTNKQCGGILLKNFPEGKCDKKMEKHEALLTVIAACNLTAQEQERLEEAEVAVTSAGRKGTIDLKIKMGHADGLMRKIWSQLEKPCKEEGVRRFQIEASSQVTPPRVKRHTEFQRARIRVTEIIMKEEERKAREGGKEKRSEARETQMDTTTYENKADSQIEAPKLLPEGEIQCDKKEVNEVQIAARDTEEMLEVLQAREHISVPASSVEDISALKETMPDGEIVRVKKQRWTPEAGFRRCGLKCKGCAEKCAEQGLEDCQNCHLNKTKKKNNNPCANRGECADPKPAMMQKPKAQGKKPSSHLDVPHKENSLEKSPMTSSLVGKQVVSYVQDHVEGLVQKIENNGIDEGEDDSQGGKKRRIEAGSTPEDQRRVSKIAMSKIGGGSKIAPPTKTQNLIM